MPNLRIRIRVELANRRLNQSKILFTEEQFLSPGAEDGNLFQFPNVLLVFTVGVKTLLRH